MNHELSCYKVFTNTSMIPKISTFSTDTLCTEVQQEGGTAEEMAKQLGTEFITLQQARLNEEATKEQLMNKMAVSNSQFVAMKEHERKNNLIIETHLVPDSPHGRIESMAEVLHAISKTCFIFLQLLPIRLTEKKHVKCEDS